MQMQFSTWLKTTNEYKTTYNVVAKIKGVKRPSEAIVYSAHWDGLGIRSPDAKGDSIYNGASDNALGTAVLLELANAFKKLNPKPDRTIVFLCVAGEEVGHLGSLWYTQHTPVDQKQTIANINIDGFNRYGKTKDMSLIGAGHSEMEDYFTKEIKKQGRYVSSDPEPKANNYFGSDHLSFAKAGIPVLFFVRGTDYVKGGKEYESVVQKNYYGYHTPNDEYNEAWRFDGTLQDMQVIFNIGYMLANGSIYPKWKPTSDFDNNGIRR
jgi:Zn-dependent M28 family amino/carboxypeptidase